MIVILLLINGFCQLAIFKLLDYLRWIADYRELWLNLCMELNIVDKRIVRIDKIFLRKVQLEKTG